MDPSAVVVVRHEFREPRGQPRNGTVAGGRLARFGASVSIGEEEIQGTRSGWTQNTHA